MVELQTLIAYPDRKGYGTRTMQQVCAIADRLGVRLWLNAYPYGRDRERIPLPKLIQFYRGFGFFPIARVDQRWINGFHRWEGNRFQHPMIRNPKMPLHMIDARCATAPLDLRHVCEAGAGCSENHPT